MPNDKKKVKDIPEAPPLEELPEAPALEPDKSDGLDSYVNSYLDQKDNSSDQDYQQRGFFANLISGLKNYIPAFQTPPVVQGFKALADPRSWDDSDSTASLPMPEDLSMLSVASPILNSIKQLGSGNVTGAAGNLIGNYGPLALFGAEKPNIPTAGSVESISRLPIIKRIPGAGVLGDLLELRRKSAEKTAPEKYPVVRPKSPEGSEFMGNKKEPSKFKVASPEKPKLQKEPEKYQVPAPEKPKSESPKEPLKFKVSSPEKPKGSQYMGNKSEEKEPAKFKVSPPEKPKSSPEEKTPPKFQVKPPESPKGTSFIRNEGEEEEEDPMTKTEEKPKSTEKSRGGTEQQGPKELSSAGRDVGATYDANSAAHAKRLAEYSKSSGEPLPKLNSSAEERKNFTSKARPEIKKVRSHGFSDNTLKQAHEILGTQP